MKRLLTLFFTMSLTLFIFLPIVTRAYATDTNIPVLGDLSKNQDQLDSYNVSPISSDKEAIIFLKHRMLYRKSSIIMKLSNTYAQEVKKRFPFGYFTNQKYVDYLLDQVCEHNGVPNQGDYLRRSFSTFTTRHNEDENGYVLTLYLTYQTDLIDKDIPSLEKEKQVDEKIKELLSPGGDLATINSPNVSDFEKARVIAQWIGAHTDYDYDKNPGHSAWSGFIRHKAVCDGLASMYHRLLLAVGVESRIITGTLIGRGEHAWNIVKIGDKYYHVDITACLDAKDDDIHSVFLREEEDIDAYKRNPKYTNPDFLTAHPMSQTRYNYIMKDVKNPLYKGILRYNGINNPKFDSGVTQRNSGIAGDNVRWEYSAGTIKIFGKGDMYDYPDAAATPWNEYANNIKNIVIGENVTSIGNNAFINTNLSKDNSHVSFSQSVAKIRANAFAKQTTDEKLADPKPMAELYEPLFERYVALDAGDPIPDPTSIVLNKADDNFKGYKLPKGTVITFTQEIDSKIPGEHTAKIKFTYPDTSFKIYDFSPIYVRNNKFSGKISRITLNAEPNRTKYIKGKETFNSAGLSIKVIDELGNYKIIQPAEFKENGIAIYQDGQLSNELNEGDIITKYRVFIAYKNASFNKAFHQLDLILTAMNDNPEEYSQPEATPTLEWEQNKPFNDASLFVANRENLPQSTQYAVVADKESGAAKTVDTSTIKEEEVLVKVAYPNNKVEYVNSKIKIVPAKPVVKEAEKYTPAAASEIAAKQGESITDQQLLAAVNKVGLPENIQLSIKERASTDTPGTYKASVLITYADSSTDTVEITIKVSKKEEQPNSADNTETPADAGENSQPATTENTENTSNTGDTNQPETSGDTNQPSISEDNGNSTNTEQNHQPNTPRSNGNQPENPKGTPAAQPANSGNTSQITKPASVNHTKNQSVTHLSGAKQSSNLAGTDKTNDTSANNQQKTAIIPNQSKNSTGDSKPEKTGETAIIADNKPLKGEKQNDKNMPNKGYSVYIAMGSILLATLLLIISLLKNRLRKK